MSGSMTLSTGTILQIGGAGNGTLGIGDDLEVTEGYAEQTGAATTAAYLKGRLDGYRDCLAALHQ